jgi:glycosyltransferase involved in cell wall biosynthesis
VIAGEGPERRSLERRIVDHGLQSAITLSGTVYPTAALLARAHVFVFPSLIEPQGLALLEAYAAGLPVIASRTGGIPEMLEDGVDGGLVEPGDAAGLAAAIIGLLNDPDRRTAYTIHARRRLDAFDIEGIADEYVELYRTVAEAGPAR